MSALVSIAIAMFAACLFLLSRMWRLPLRQIGFLLIKGVFVRWRMPLPANRTEDFRRWRAAWLNHNLKIFDALRVYAAVVLLTTTVWINYGRSLPHSFQIGFLAAGVLVCLLYLGYVLREGRILSAAERDMKPIELVKEFPRSPVAEGRYLAGGLLYFNRENPGNCCKGHSRHRYQPGATYHLCLGGILPGAGRIDDMDGLDGAVGQPSRSGIVVFTEGRSSNKPGNLR